MTYIIVKSDFLAGSFTSTNEATNLATHDNWKMPDAFVTTVTNSHAWAGPS